MKNFNIKTLWDLRGKLDSSVISGDYASIPAIKEEYNELVKFNGLHNRAFICFNYGFWSDYDKHIHHFENVNSILKNINNFEKKFIKGEDVSLKLKNVYSSPFFAGEIWVLRAMYDKFIFDAQNFQMDDASIQQNMLLGKTVMNRLGELMTMEQTEYWHDTIKTEFLSEVRESYESIYGKDKPKVTYEQISRDFMEMR
jgi:hypothetical protein